MALATKRLLRWACLLGGAATTSLLGQAGARIAYQTNQDALVVVEAGLRLEIPGANPAAITAQEVGPRLKHFHLHYAGATELPALRLTTSSGDRVGQVRLAGRPSERLRLRLTGAIPPEADPADLELAAAGLQVQAAAASVSVGGLFDFSGSDRLAAPVYERAAHARLADPSWQGVWRTGAHYGVLGALDYGPRQAGRHWSNRTAALSAMARYWPTPNQPLPATAAVYEFRLGDVAGFVLDGFSLAGGVEAAPAERTILGRAQEAWLANALAASDASFKLVFCGRSLFVPTREGFSLQSFEKASRDLLKVLEAAEGVVLITSGGPVGELTRYIRASNYPLNELSLGPLASSPGTQPPYRGLNYFRVPGTLVRTPHFAFLEVSGEPGQRRLRVSVHQLDGAEIWAETLAQDELKP